MPGNARDRNPQSSAIRGVHAGRLGELPRLGVDYYITQLVAEGDRVAMWATYEATQTGPMGPFPAGGKSMSLDIAGIFRVADGKIAELWATWDNLSALTQLGHMPPGS